MKTRKRIHKKFKKNTLRRRRKTKRRGGNREFVLSPGDVDSPSGSAFGQGQSMQSAISDIKVNSSSENP
jgi:hypothetical protein